MRLPSTTAAWSTQVTPALTMSSRIAATLVARRPLTIFAEIGTQPAWRKGNRLARVIEGPHQGKHGLRSPQRVRCVPRRG